MTIERIIREVDNLKNNKFTRDEKIGWLSDLDSMIKKNIIDTHENSDSVSFSEYTTDTALDTKLLVESPYDIMYRYYLEAQIDLANQEIDKYNNSIALYNASYDNYTKYYNRKHMPLQENKISLIRK